MARGCAGKRLRRKEEQIPEGGIGLRTSGYENSSARERLSRARSQACYSSCHRAWFKISSSPRAKKVVTNKRMDGSSIQD